MLHLLERLGKLLQGYHELGIGLFEETITECPQYLQSIHIEE